MAHAERSAVGYSFRGIRIPDAGAFSLDLYIEHGCPPGSFLQAVLANDLMDAFGRADSVNAEAIAAYAGYLYNEAPRACWGSREAVADWMRERMKERAQASAQAA